MVARRRMAMADIKEILVGWDVGESVSAIARRLGYRGVTVSKYVQAAEEVGLCRGGGRRQEVEWDRLAEGAIAQVTKPRAPGSARCEVAQYHTYVEPRLGTVPLSVLHQRLRDEHGLPASWRTVHPYVQAHLPARAHSGGHFRHPGGGRGCAPGGGGGLGRRGFVWGARGGGAPHKFARRPPERRLANPRAPGAPGRPPPATTASWSIPPACNIP